MTASRPDAYDDALSALRNHVDDLGEIRRSDDASAARADELLRGER
jgi:hypothetical protein